jgi:hypothetical protein
VLMDEQTLAIKPSTVATDDKAGDVGPVRCILVVPKKTAAGNPWSWWSLYRNHQPTAETEPLARGFHLAYCSRMADADRALPSDGFHFRSAGRSHCPESRQIERPNRRPSPPISASYRHDDLAELLVRFQIPVGLDDLLKRERLGDDRLQPAIRQTRVDERLGPFQTPGVARDLHHHVAADREPLSQDVEQGQRRRLRAQGPVEEDDAQTGRRLGEFGDGRAADGAENDAGSLAVIFNVSSTRSCSSVTITRAAPALRRSSRLEFPRVKATGTAKLRIQTGGRLPLIRT